MKYTKVLIIFPEILSKHTLFKSVVDNLRNQYYTILQAEAYEPITTK